MTCFCVNFSITSPQAAWFKFKTVAISSTTYPLANWTVLTSSTGSGGVYAQSGDVIVSSSSLGNLSWFVMRGKGTLDGGVIYYRELCFQFDTSGNVRITYSPRSGFVGGSPSTTQVPTAEDEEILYGGGTDASPTFAQLLPTAGAWMQGRFSEVDDAFYVFTYGVGGTLPSAMFYLETVPPVYTVGGSLVDPDPVVLYARYSGNSTLRSDLASEARGPFGMLSYGVAGSSLWCRLAASYRAVLDSSDVAQPELPGSLTTPPGPYYNVPTYPQDTLLYGRRTALAGVAEPGDVGNLNTTGWKGEGMYLRWAGTTFAVPQLVNLVSISTGGLSSGVVMAFGQLMAPWEIAVAPSL